jgi:hypothetical protein
MQERYERTCKICGKKKVFLWKEISRWMRNNKGRPLEDWMCNICTLKNRNTSHGESKIPLYTHWKSMFVRVRGSGNPSDATIKAYSDKGIKVCNEWYEFPTFKKWAEKNGFKPDSGLVINRIDSSKDYCPENCEWLTKSEHASKDRRNTLLREEGLK